MGRLRERLLYPLTPRETLQTAIIDHKAPVPSPQFAHSSSQGLNVNTHLLAIPFPCNQYQVSGGQGARASLHRG